MGKTLFVCALALTACGGDDGNTDTKKDAAGSGSGSNTNTVQKVTCSGTPAKVTADAAQMTKYTYSTGATLSVHVGDMVEFQMPANHNVRPGTGVDPGLTVDFGQDVCLKFTTAGTYNFYCQPHGFTGTLTVQ
ncbi:MAG: plastocyanin/azurin family copper-binding protein [Kofleriaceae bacterium]